MRPAAPRCPASGGGSGGSLTITEYCDQQAAAYCNRYTSCQDQDSAQNADCIASEKELCTSSSSIRYANAGALTFNGTQAKTCVDAINAGNCPSVIFDASTYWLSRTDFSRSPR